MRVRLDFTHAGPAEAGADFTADNLLVAGRLIDADREAFGGDAVFADMESGERLTTRPWQIEGSYRQAMREFVEGYRRQCREHAVDYILMDTTTPYDVALTEYLSKRKRI